ncbi:hypothetical protein SAMN06297382_1347 [Amphiplicatus metriothermophilus]|uniref:Uncharacterized protein n=1 Tax=Amphiplicatus metriothermophilus TaxID=1519374 RepID=A0A239PPS4_9PROT|nr:hypothetical protein [Amphiplicatus metriothermophilus]SNT72309.1 hypothetical protein SAMN06297382_1347 [Amphiplicatus metriothermophilus]
MLLASDFVLYMHETGNATCMNVYAYWRGMFAP